ncbi:hypothetical protein GQ43DRAFT_440709 [Delitschia confertaspora ATCC 74209]|uniref:Flavin reductase like domain-containing protein n=1 Tax=Delitschia confertaspora ATCC 74209 TaxID=1513339 RepID=A0A9P4JLH6_9PLEO|nr:hypothetical protein GQ43DRAFT_440709 [Delitschia confertaspora ATCC 74209]
MASTVSSRFFAAFWRWNECTRPTAHCTYRQTLLSQHHLGPRHSRGFLSTPQYRQSLGDKAPENGLPITSTPVDLLTSSSRARTSNTPLSKTHPSESPLPSRMRALMRHVPHPTIVITAVLRDHKTLKSTPQAMCASSFNTITIAPVPTIAFNIKLPSRTWDAITSNSGHFRIHILKNSEKGAMIADAFTRGDAAAGFKTLGPIVKTEPEELEMHKEFSRVPRIEDDAVMTVLDCKLVKEMRVRDHVITVSEVESIHWDGEGGDTLMYVDGAFKQIGKTVWDRLVR